MESVEVEVLFPGGKQVDARIKNRTVCTDQSREHGGKGEAPVPFDLLLAALATCAGHYANTFCERRKISPQGLALTMSCRTDAKGARMEAVTFNLTLPADFPEKYRAAIVRAMDTCAVKKFVSNPPEFSTVVNTP